MLIINDKINMFQIGYPTKSDKYNVAGGTFEGATSVKFGDLVAYGSATGYYKTAVGVTDVKNIAGFVLGVNVRLAEGYPGGEPEIKAGTQFDLVLPGSYLAIELDPGCTVSKITPNAEICVTLATGKLTTVDKYAQGTVEKLPNVVFTGLYEDQGTADAHKYIAEVLVK